MENAHPSEHSYPAVVWATPNGDSLVARIARVSNPENADNPKYVGLVKYLIRNNHWSPFEMVSMCVSILTTRDISAQILRHRSFSFQEFSQRYSVPPPPAVPSLRREHAVARQSSVDDLPDSVVTPLQSQISEHLAASQRLYETLRSNGVAKECARRTLPLVTPTHIYMSGTLRSWLHYVALRTTPETQAEHRSIATHIARLIETEFPIAAKAFYSQHPHIETAMIELIH